MEKGYVVMLNELYFSKMPDHNNGKWERKGFLIFDEA